jgi:PAS domain S-box-containing protein
MATPLLDLHKRKKQSLSSGDTCHHPPAMNGDAHHCHSSSLLLNDVSFPLFVLDHNGCVVAWNSVVKELLGYEFHDVYGQTVMFISSESHALWEDCYLNVLTDGRKRSCNVQVSTKYDTIIHCNFKFSPQRATVQGPVYGVMCLVEEIIHETETNEALNDKTLATDDIAVHVDNIPLPVCCVDLEVKVIRWNAKMSALTEYGADNILQRPLDSICAAIEDGERIRNICAMSVRGVEGSTIVTFKLSSKRSVTIKLVASVVKDKHGTACGIALFADDVTNEEELRKELEDYHATIEEASIPVFCVDSQGIIYQWNKRAAEITGYSSSDAIGKHFVNTLIPASYRKVVQNAMNESLKGHGSTSVELVIETKDGSPRYLLASLTPRHFQNKVVGTFVISADVTESAQHERVVAGIAKELRQLIDTTNTPIFGVDLDGRINEWNNKIAVITDYTGDEAFNQYFVDTFVVRQYQESVRSVLQCAMKGRGTTNFELEIRTKSRETRYFLVNFTTRRDLENRIAGVVAVAQDVTESFKHDRAVAAMASELRQLIDTANAPIFGIDCDG